MNTKRILALSSSRSGNSGYLETALPAIQSFLGQNPLQIAFVPFASTANNYGDYGKMVDDALYVLPHQITVVLPHTAKQVLQQCDVIMVGGGNTFKLLHDIYASDTFNLIVDRVNKGTPYIGWSAGSNLAGLTIGTTNDMPVIEPQSFKAFGFFPFQINPHYINQTAEGFHGETRDQRLSEFLQVNPAKKIIGLPEGTALELKENRLTFKGWHTGALFEMGGDLSIQKNNITPGQDLTFLL
jgi:dipeptidase E